MCECSVFKNAYVHRKAQPQRFHALYILRDPQSLCSAVVKHYVNIFSVRRGSDRWYMSGFMHRYTLNPSSVEYKQQLYSDLVS